MVQARFICLSVAVLSTVGATFNAEARERRAAAGADQPAYRQTAAYTQPPHQNQSVRWFIPAPPWADEEEQNQNVPPARYQRGPSARPEGDRRGWYMPNADNSGVRQYASYGTQPTAAYEPYPSAPPPAYRATMPERQPTPGGIANPRYRRQVVMYDGSANPGTVVIDTENKFLYLVLDGGRALRYGVGVGRPGFEWSGVKSVSRKSEWPDWTPPDEMLLRRPDLPRFMPGGPSNPLGARAMYLGSSLFRIHGTNEPETIGTAVSSGCIRMVNDDVIDLYERVKVGTKVIVI